MADAEFVTIAHQDDMYCRNYGEELLKAAAKYPDMTVFTSDYAILKNKKVIIGDKMLWVKRFFAYSPAFSQALQFKTSKNNAPCIWESHLLPGNYLQ